MAARPFPSLTFLPPHGHGRTLFLAGSFLGLCALGQFSALAWYLAQGGTHRAGAEPTEATVAAVSTAAALPRETPPLALPQPTPLAANFPPPPAPGPAAPAATPLAPDPVALTGPAPVFNQPTPAPPAARNAPGSPSVAAELVEQAKVLRARGDTQSALARLREAQNAGTGADNPLVIAEMALTFEAMQLPDRANVQWNRLLELGESVGAPYYLAESRLRANGMPPGPDADPGHADPAGTGRDRGGFQANALLRILKTTVEEDADPGAERKHALRIVVKNRPGTAIDARKVRVEAQFYDQLDGKEIVQTDAETGFRWLTPPVDWANDSSEELETTYFRPKNGELSLNNVGAGPGNGGSSSALLPPPPPPRAGSPPSSRRGGGGNRNRRTPAPPPAAPTPALTLDAVPPAPSRVYLGYIVRLYYNRQLQDVRAEPADLLQRFPPVLTLPADLTQPAEQPIGQQ